MSHKLTPKQYKALHMLAQGLTQKEVATKLKLRRETLSRWKQIPKFDYEFERLVTGACQGLRHRLLRLVDQSIVLISTQLNAEYMNEYKIKLALNILQVLGIERAVGPNAFHATPEVIENTKKIPDSL